MQVAKKSLDKRRTVTLPSAVIQLLDEMRGEIPKSRYVEQLLKEAHTANQNAAFYAEAVEAYTPLVCEETLALNHDFPIHDA